MFIIVPNCPISEFKFYDEGFENWKRLCKLIKNIKKFEKRIQEEKKRQAEGQRERDRERQRDRDRRS